MDEVGYQTWLRCWTMRRAWLDRERGKVMKIVARGGEAMRVAWDFRGGLYTQQMEEETQVWGKGGEIINS